MQAHHSVVVHHQPRLHIRVQQRHGDERRTFALGCTLNDTRQIQQLNLGIIVMDDARNAGQGCEFLITNRQAISHDASLMEVRTERAPLQLAFSNQAA